MIELIDVSKKFKDNVLFHGVSFKINSPGIYSFVGDNGVGKTTLLNIINRSTSVSSGKVINSHKNISFVSQKVNLIDHLTIKEHFDIYKLKHSLLRKFNLLHKLNSYPRELSLGQRQRISCIIGLYSPSTLLIIDEPTSHLDNKNALIMFKEIKKVSEYKTVLLVSHNQNLVNEYSDAIYELDNNVLSLIKKNGVQDRKFIRQKIKLNFKRYIKKSILKNKKINLFYSLIIFILSFLLLLTNSISFSLDSVISEEKKYALDYNKFYLRECESINKSGIVIKKCSNLSEEKLEKLNDYKVSLNLDLLMNSLYESNNFSAISYDDYSLKKGRYPSKYNEIITNDNYDIGDVITLESSKIITYEKTDLYFNTLQLTVVGTVEDKHLLKDDKYYLDYDLLSEYLKEEKLINNNIDLYSYFKWLEIDSYKYVLYFDDIDISVLTKNSIEYLSSSYEYYESLSSLNNEISYYFKYINYLVIPLCLYYFIRLLNKKLKLKEKEILFLKANLVKENKIIKIMNKENRYIIMFSCVLSCLVVNMIIFLIFKDIFIDGLSVLLIFIFLLIVSSLLVKITFKKRMSI